jgi:hypothetical protein
MTVDKALRWANHMFAKKTDDKKMEDFFKDIKLEDLDAFQAFLASDIITWEVLE